MSKAWSVSYVPLVIRSGGWGARNRFSPAVDAAKGILR